MRPWRLVVVGVRAGVMDRLVLREEAVVATGGVDWAVEVRPRVVVGLAVEVLGEGVVLRVPGAVVVVGVVPDWVVEPPY